jgi:hypothetical protein
MAEKKQYRHYTPIINYQNFDGYNHGFFADPLGRGIGTTTDYLKPSTPFIDFDSNDYIISY